MKYISYKFRLYPTKEQKILLEKHFNASRFVYNLGLARKIEEYETNKKTLSCFDLSKELTQLKKTDDYKWLNEVSANSLQYPFRNLDTAFRKFFKEKKGFPKFKKKSKTKKSFTVEQACKIEDNKIKILKFQEGIKAVITRKIEGELGTFTVSQSPSGKYFVSITSKIDEDLPKKKEPNENKTIGIDLGLKHFATISTGEKIYNPKYLEKSIKKLKKLHRQHSKKIKGSNNRKKSKKKLALCYEKINNKREHFLHTLSSRLVSENQGIAIEDLAVKNMLKNHCLAKSISSASWSKFMTMLEYKSEWNGKNLYVIGRFDPSSKICSCGKINNDLKLSDRIWTCKHCNLTHDRDLLASKNIVKFAFSRVKSTRINACGE